MSIGQSLVAWGIAIGLGLATSFAWFIIPHAPNLDPLIVLVLIFNVTLILVALGFEIGRRPYSLHVMHLISLFLFLGISSLLQYSGGRFGVAGPTRNVSAQILPAAASVTLWLVGYLIAYEGSRSLRVRRRPGPVARFLLRPITSSSALVLGIAGVLDFVLLAGIGLLGVTTRGAAETAMGDFARGAGAGDYTGTLFIVSGTLLRPLPVIALLVVLLILSRGDRGRLKLLPFALLLGMGTLILNNPFASSRMFFTATLFGFAAPFLLRRFKTSWAVIFSILAGLAFLPALSDSREMMEFGEFTSYFTLASPLGYLGQSSDVDALGMTTLCQKWVEVHGHRWGAQILGALLFWFPRALWEGKPIATGAMVTRDLGFDFTNLSPPISAEALVDFGLIGVPFLGAFFGFLLMRLDAAYWAPGRESLGSSRRIIDAIFPFWLICVVYFTRGDLFAAMSFLVGFTVWVLPLGLRWVPLQREVGRSATDLGPASTDKRIRT